MKFKIYQLPFMLIILAMPIPWASSFPSLGLVTWLPEMVAIFIYLYMFSSGKFNLTFKKSHFIVVLILFVHLVYQIVSGKGVGGGAIISVSLMSVLFFIFFKAGYLNKNYKNIISQINVIYIIHISFILVELILIKQGAADILLGLSNGNYKAGLPEEYALVPQSILKQSQAASMLCFFSASWFYMLYISRKKLNVNYEIKFFIVLISSIVLFIIYPTTTMLIVALIILFFVIYLIPFSRNLFFRLLIPVIALLFFEPVYFMVTYKLNPELYGNALLYQNSFTSPIIVFFELPLAEQLWGLGNLDHVVQAGLKAADFGAGVAVLQIGIILGIVLILILLSMTLQMLRFSYKKYMHNLFCFPWVWLGTVNALFVIGGLLSLVQYTPIIQTGGRTLFSYHIAITMFSLYQLVVYRRSLKSQGHEN